VQPNGQGRVEPRRVQAAGAPGGGAGGGAEGAARRRGARARGAAQRVRAHGGPVPVRRGRGEGGGMVDVPRRRGPAGGEAPAARGVVQPRHAALGTRRYVRSLVLLNSLILRACAAYSVRFDRSFSSAYIYLLSCSHGINYLCGCTRTNKAITSTPGSNTIGMQDVEVQNYKLSR
jgi:hypothetical protein